MPDVSALPGPDLFVNPDAFIHVVDDAWVISNPRVRTHVELTAAGVAALAGNRADAAIAQDTWSGRLRDVTGRDRTRRGIGEQGLVADHSGLRLDAAAPWLGGAALVDLLVARRILINTAAAGLAAAQPLANLLDRERLGTFHQRVGQYLLVDRREREPWRAWQNQKFAADGRTLLDTPYRRVQEPFFDQFFTTERVRGLQVLDFGCGNGYYTAKFAQRGARVVGFDNSAELLAMARANHGGLAGLELVMTPSFEDVIARLAVMGEGSVDLIYLQDTLLLLLQPEAGPPSPALPNLLLALRRVLRHGGTLCAMEPNPVFWLASRHGAPDRPYAVVTEYRHPVFNVAPTLDRVLAVMSAAGFALSELKHPDSLTTDGPDAGYLSEFPLWDFLVFVPV